MRAPVLTQKRAKRLRRSLTLPEILLWQDLRKGQLKTLHIRRQHAIGPYILDFFCAEHSLAIEIDGTTHDHPDQASHDQRRDAWLKTQGIRTLRFPATDILNDRERELVLRTIAAACGKSD